MKHIPIVKAYVIQLNSFAHLEKDFIIAWLNKNVKGYVLDNQLINVTFFSEDDAFLFHLTFFKCMQSYHLREIQYKPQNEKILSILNEFYQTGIIK